MRPQVTTQRFNKRSGDGEVDVVLPVGAKAVQYFYPGADEGHVMARKDFDRLYVREGMPLEPFRVTELVAGAGKTSKPRDDAPAFEGAAREQPRVEASPGALTAMYAEEVLQAIRDAADRIVVALREVQAMLMARDLSAELAAGDAPSSPPRPPAAASNTDRDVTPAKDPT